MQRLPAARAGYSAYELDDSAAQIVRSDVELTATTITSAADQNEPAGGNERGRSDRHQDASGGVTGAHVGDNCAHHHQYEGGGCRDSERRVNEPESNASGSAEFEDAEYAVLVDGYSDVFGCFTHWL